MLREDHEKEGGGAQGLSVGLGEHMGHDDASRYRDFLLASTVLCAPQARCVMTALIGLQVVTMVTMMAMTMMAMLVKSWW